MDFTYISSFSELDLIYKIGFSSFGLGGNPHYLTKLLGEIPSLVVNIAHWVNIVHEIIQISN